MSISGPQDARRAALERIAAMVRDAKPMACPVFARPEAADASLKAGATDTAQTAQTSIRSTLPEDGEVFTKPHEPPPALSAAERANGAGDAPSRTGRSAAAASQQAAGPSRRYAKAKAERKSHAVLNRELALYPLTDLGNAERFEARFGEDLRFVPNFGWYFWDGKRWSKKGADGFVVRAEQETVRGIQSEADAITGTSDDRTVSIRHAGKKNQEPLLLSDALRAWGRQSEAAQRISVIARNAAAHLEREFADFDKDPFKINFSNHTLTVRRVGSCPDGEPLIICTPPQRDDYITKISPIEYDPKAICPLFDRFFPRVQPNEAQRRFLMQWLGYSLTGDATEHKMAVFWGNGRNGKGTLIETVAEIAGDYADSVPIETFLASSVQRSGGQATPDLAKLLGVRFLRAGEPEKGAKLGEALIKKVAGGDPIDARNLNKEFFTYRAQFKFTMACNWKPQVAGTDEGIWGRVILVPWTEFIPPEERDLQLTEKLLREASGILNRLLDGLRDYLENGLIQGDHIAQATAKYRRESDTVGRFLEKCTVRSTGNRVQSSVLYAIYKAWAQYNDGPNYSQKGLSGILSDRGYEKYKDNDMFWRDMRLLKTEADYPLDQTGKPLRRDEKADSDGGGNGATDTELAF